MTENGNTNSVNLHTQVTKATDHKFSFGCCQCCNGTVTSNNNKKSIRFIFCFAPNSVSALYLLRCKYASKFTSIDLTSDLLGFHCAIMWKWMTIAVCVSLCRTGHNVAYESIANKLFIWSYACESIAIKSRLLKPIRI